MLTAGWITLAVLVFVFGMLALSRFSPDAILLAGLTVLLVLGVVTPRQAFSGFSNEGVVTVAILFLVAAGTKESGAIYLAVNWLLRRPRNVGTAQATLMLPVAGLSAFLNNTPLVLMLIPVVSEWGKKFQIPISKLLIPLSYAALLGGMCTLIGTSTNLVVNGLLVDSGIGNLRLFDIAWVGVPIAMAGMLYIVAAGRWLLPDRRPAASILDDPREYSVEMVVEENSPLNGQTIEDAGLCHLPGLYLLEIERDGQIIPAVGPEERLRSRDRLVFVGIVDSIIDLQKIRGLKPATDQVFKLNSPRRERVLIEAVLSHTSPLAGKTIREGKFRTRYDAAIIAVARNGQRIRKKVGDIILQAGDTLLLEAHSSFVEVHRNSRDFYLVSQIEGYNPPSYEKGWLALGIMAALVASVTLGFLSMLQAALLAAGAMVLTGCLSADGARKSVDWRLLVAIASAFGIGQAMDVTGTARHIADVLIGLGGRNLWLSFAIVYTLTMIFTEIVTNNAAAVLMFPVAVAAAQSLGVDPMPFVIAVMIAASAGFATPIGYQTHLMVYGPGGYKFTDFLRIGVPMNLIVMLVALLVIPRVWPFLQ